VIRNYPWGSHLHPLCDLVTPMTSGPATEHISRSQPGWYCTFTIGGRM